MESVSCLRIKKVWHASQTSNNMLPTRGRQFAPKHTDILEQCRLHAPDSSLNDGQVDHINVFNNTDSNNRSSKITKADIPCLTCPSNAEDITDKYGESSIKRTNPKEEQKMLDDKARIDRNKMLIRRQKELATRRNYLRKQHQIKTGALKTMQQDEKMARGDTIAYRLAARKSFLTLQVRLKKVHRDLLISLRKYITNGMAENYVALNKSEPDVKGCSGGRDTESQKKGDEESEHDVEKYGVSSCCDTDAKLTCEVRNKKQSTPDCFQTEQENNIKRLTAAYERFIQLPLSPYLLVTNPTIVYDIIKTFACVTSAEVKDLQRQVLNRMRSMFLLYDFDSFIGVFVEKATKYKKIRYDRLLHLEFLHDAQTQTDCSRELIPAMTEADSSVAVVPENRSHMYRESLDHIVEAQDKEILLDSLCPNLKKQCSSFNKMNIDQNTEVDHDARNGMQLKTRRNPIEVECITAEDNSTEDGAVPGTYSNEDGAPIDTSAQVVPSSTKKVSCEEAFPDNMIKDCLESDDIDFFISEVENFPSKKHVKTCQQMDSSEQFRSLMSSEE